MLKNVSIIIAITLLAACGSSSHIKDFDAYQKAPLVRASIMPSKTQLSRDRARVVVLAIEDSDNELAKKSKLGTTLRKKVESLLAESGVDVIDRKLAATLKKEIMLAEMKGIHDYKGPEVADYSVTGEVMAVKFSTSYTKASTWVDKKGESHYSPPRCRYSVQFEALLKIHALPSLRMVDVIKLKETEARSIELLNSYSRRCPAYSESQLHNLVAETAVEAVIDSEIELKNNFAPQGYVTEARIHEDKNIFKITIGNRVGVKKGQAANVIQFVRNEDALTGETNIEEIKLVSAIVSDNVSSKYAWIIIADSEKAKRIRLGDAVKIHFENSWFGKMKHVF